MIAIRKIDDQAKNRDHDRDQNGDRQTLPLVRMTEIILAPTAKGTRVLMSFYYGLNEITESTGSKRS